MTAARILEPCSKLANRHREDGQPARRGLPSLPSGGAVASPDLLGLRGLLRRRLRGRLPLPSHRSGPALPRETVRLDPTRPPLYHAWPTCI